MRSARAVLGTRKWRVPLPDGTTLVVKTPHGWTAERARQKALEAYQKGELPEVGEPPLPEVTEAQRAVLERLEGNLSKRVDVDVPVLEGALDGAEGLEEAAAPE